ncbi:hypothetical protein H2203_005721 [Taxawa tesnikishii (nom. ined.)]|nr:hypothetical protein H2203_005721 [Dothideales sp. JES 119]
MPDYPGIQYSIIVTEDGDNINRLPVSPREWYRAYEDRGNHAGYRVLGRQRNTEAELWMDDRTLLTLVDLQDRLGSWGYTVSYYHSSNHASLELGRSMLQRSAAQLIQDMLWNTWFCEKTDVDNAVIAGTPDDKLLICKLSTSTYDPKLPPSETFTANGVTYPIIGQVAKNEASFFNSSDQDLKKYLRVNEQRTLRWVDFRFFDLEAQEKDEAKRKKERERKREQRRRQRARAREAREAGSGTEVLGDAMAQSNASD